ALFGLDPGVVVYLGTTSKILTPALRVGWLVAGQELVARLAEVAAGLGDGAGGPPQRALLSLIGTGELERHLRRVRHGCARRRKAMASALGAGGAGGVGTAGRLLGEEAGMHMVLRTGRDAEEVARAAWERGVAVAMLARYYAGPVTANGLVLGYGGAGSDEVTPGRPGVGGPGTPPQRSGPGAGAGGGHGPRGGATGRG